MHKVRKTHTTAATAPLTGSRGPFFIRMKSDEPFAFAGLWERWRESADAEPVDTYVILTTLPNDLMRDTTTDCPSSSRNGTTSGGWTAR